jgi:hypothetical protein
VWQHGLMDHALFAAVFDLWPKGSIRPEAVDRRYISNFGSVVALANEIPRIRPVVVRINFVYGTHLKYQHRKNPGESAFRTSSRQIYFRR